MTPPAATAATQKTADLRRLFLVPATVPRGDTKIRRFRIASTTTPRRRA